MPLAAGDSFAGFTVVRQLGSGGMGEVYLVDHPRLPRYEALKIMPPAVSANVEFRQRFNREAELAAELWHPHIVSVHDRGEADGHLWITMDYVEGTDAGHFIAENYPSGVPISVAAAIVTAVADALDYAHERGMLHRDVKPANVLLNNPEAARGQRILLSDFGLARELEDSSGLTATNMTVGSIHYAAPEQLMGQRLDGRADQYALGATAFHLLTGRPPFDNSKAAVVISSHLTTPVPSMATNRPDLAPLDPVIAKAMAKDPAERFESCHEFARQLAEVVASGPDNRGATLVTPATPAPAVKARTGPPQLSDETSVIPAASPRRSRRGLLIGGAVAAVLVVAAAAVLIPTLASDDADSAQSTSTAPAYGTEGSAASTRVVLPDNAPSFLLTVSAMSEVAGVQLAETEVINTQLYDTTGQVEPPDCAGAVVTGTEFVYGPGSFNGVHITRYSAADAGTTAYAEQTMVLALSAEGAVQVLNSSRSQWEACAGTAVTNTGVPYTVTPGTPEASDNTITMTATVTGDSYGAQGYGDGAFRCQHTLGIWSNAVVEALVCDDTAPDNQSQTIVERVLQATAQG